MKFLMDWFEALTLSEQIYACIAVVFTVLLILQFILLLIGAASHAGDMDGHDMGGDGGHDFGHGHDVGHDYGHDFSHDVGHDVGHDIGHDFGHSFGHGDVGQLHGDFGHDVGHDFGHDIGHDAGHDFAHDAHGDLSHDGTYDYHHDMDAGHDHVGQVAHEFAELQDGIVVDVHNGDIYLADAVPHVAAANGPDVGIPDQDLPDGRTYVDPADKAHGSGFRLITMQGVIAFFCIFGWTGLLFLKGGLPIWGASLLAFVCGFAALFLMGLALWGMQKIQADGTLNVRYALGRSGEVYIPIPAERKEPGKVMVEVQDQLMEFEAVTDEAEKIPTGTQVTVIGITKGTTLIVTKHN